MPSAGLAFPEGRLLVFCRAPVAGQVKTRLARGIGDRAAARWHRALAAHCLATVAGAGLAPVQLWCAPDTRHPFFGAQRRIHGLTLHAQVGADLGARMGHAFGVALREAAYAVLVGTDCPALDAGHLRRALSALRDGADWVLGPAEDGGYVLLGLRRPEPRVFRDMAWGTGGVLAETRRRLRGAGVDLETLWDVDHPADLQRLHREAGSMAVSEPLRRMLADRPGSASGR